MRIRLEHFDRLFGQYAEEKRLMTCRNGTAFVRHDAEPLRRGHWTTAYAGDLIKSR